MKENIKVKNNNLYYIGVKCQEWHKHRQIKPHSFIYLNEREVRELDSDYDLFSSGELVIDDEELNVSLGYAEKNPNSITDKEIEEIFKLPTPKIKEKLSGVTEMFALGKIYDIAKKSDLSVSKIKVIEEIIGKKIEIEDIKPVEVIGEVKPKKNKSKEDTK